MITSSPFRLSAGIGRLVTRWFLLVFMSVASDGVRAAETYFVSDEQAGVIWRLKDANGDGDALDIGERSLWADGLTTVAELDQFHGSVFAVEEGLPDGLNQVIRFTDLNADGDALDAGERSVWADGLDDPRGIALDDQGKGYVVDFEDGLVWALTDMNSDGDALDVGERTIYAEGAVGIASVAIQGNDLLLTNAFEDLVFRLTDGNSDGDALDEGENIAVTPLIDNATGVLDDGAGGFFVSSFANDTVYHAVDKNGDGDMLDVAEALSYADSVFGGIDGPWGMESHELGGFLLADYSDGQVLWARDANGDGDALDQGDVHLFADGIGSPVDIVALTECSPDADGDGDVDGLDFLIIQRTSPEDIPCWEAAYGTNALAQPVIERVPEPTALLMAVVTVYFFLTLRHRIMCFDSRLSTTVVGQRI